MSKGKGRPKHWYRILTWMKGNRKRWYQILTIVIGTILFPTVSTIILTAYEGKTNHWVYTWLGIEDEEESDLEQLKRLVADNNLIHYNCGPLGAKLEGVMKNCPDPVYSQKSMNGESTQQKIGYTKGDHYLILIDFTNDYVSRIMVKDTKKFASFTLPKIKRVFGNPSQEPLESTFDGVKRTIYTYKLPDARELSFTYNNHEKKFEQIELSSKDAHKRFKGKPTDLHQKELKPVPDEKRVKVGGMDEVRRIKQWAEQGDMVNYACGPLGTHLSDVLSTCEDSLTAKGFDKQQKTHNMTYTYKDYQVNVKFFKEVLSSISINMLDGKPLKITPEQVKQVFGEPLSERKMKLSTKEPTIFLKYQWDDKDLTFNINNGKCTGIWLRKTGMYNDQNGGLLSRFLEQHTE
ncbi:hypothetical protein GCM10007416_14050 [Kroppenstedtia guangzhouensis]|uniref:DUF4340 domain-containing protein n=1 Tax=Kroppenstedtia guangzhouensis TaxID=1274356 RepID=A0ABQ1GEI6_9BACL|nr:hypothetical protein [Kroppenstedtia guangzhouensis]GGA42266.1 hypothetical protein GCM10007416_14050 [Kroppenstedtia guangzhouensis]